MTRTEFEELIHRQSRKLYGFAFRILRNREESEDAVQEVFIKLWNMGGKLDEYKSIDALAATMTRNFCIDLIRKQKKLHLSDNASGELNSITAPSPHEQMENTESGEILNTIIEGLPESYRTAVRLRDIEGASYEEIAKETDQNINTLRVTLSRARKAIRDEYIKYQYERRGFGTPDRKVL